MAIYIYLYTWTLSRKLRRGNYKKLSLCAVSELLQCVCVCVQYLSFCGVQSFRCIWAFYTMRVRVFAVLLMWNVNGFRCFTVVSRTKCRCSDNFLFIEIRLWTTGKFVVSVLEGANGESKWLVVGGLMFTFALLAATMNFECFNFQSAMVDSERMKRMSCKFVAMEWLKYVIIKLFPRPISLSTVSR